MSSFIARIRNFSPVKNNNHYDVVQAVQFLCCITFYAWSVNSLMDIRLNDKHIATLNEIESMMKTGQRTIYAQSAYILLYLIVSLILLTTRHKEPLFSLWHCGSMIPPFFAQVVAFAFIADGGGSMDHHHYALWFFGFVMWISMFGHIWIITGREQEGKKAKIKVD